KSEIVTDGGGGSDRFFAGHRPGFVHRLYFGFGLDLDLAVGVVVDPDVTVDSDVVVDSADFVEDVVPPFAEPVQQLALVSFAPRLVRSKRRRRSCTRRLLPFALAAGIFLKPM